MRAIRVRILALSLFCIVGLTASIASASTISWGAAQNISGVTDVDTAGTLVNAYSFGNTTSPTVNGVTFLGTHPYTGDYPGTNGAGGEGGLPPGISAVTEPDPWYGGHAASTFGYGSISDPNYQSLISAAWAGDQNTDSLTLSGLTPGHQYAVQVWINDARSDQYLGQKDNIGGAVLTLQTATGTGQYAIGTFIADSTGTQTLNVNIWAPSTNNNTQYPVDEIAALQIRSIPEPSTIIILATGIAGLLAYAWRKRR